MEYLKVQYHERVITINMGKLYVSRAVKTILMTNNTQVDTNNKTTYFYLVDAGIRSRGPLNFHFYIILKIYTNMTCCIEFPINK